MIWGDGSAGTGLAIALASTRRIILAGPPGSGRGPARLRSRGAFPGTAVVQRAEPDDHPVGDSCLVAVKSYDLGSAARFAMRSTSGKCICVTNGMGLESEWGPGWNEQVEPALLTAGFTLIRKGLVETSPGGLTVQSGGEAEALFRGGPVPLEPTDDLESARWAKWIVNSTLNPLGALAGLPNDRLEGAGLGTIIDVLMSELARLVPEQYRETSAESAERMMRFLLSESGNRCSMLQDLEAGRRTEIANLAGFCATMDPGACPTAELLAALVSAREISWSGRINEPPGSPRAAVISPKPGTRS